MHVHLTGVDVALGVHCHLVQPMEFTGAAAAEGIENLHVVSSQDPDPLVGSIGDMMTDRPFIPVDPMARRMVCVR